MSSADRYLVRPDGSFTRFPNIDGRADALSEEQMESLAAATRRSVGEGPRKWCSRCGDDLVLRWKGPGWVSPVLMELCAVCDAGRPAAAAFIRWHRDPDRDPAAVAQLFDDWETETMHALGWVRTEPEEPFS